MTEVLLKSENLARAFGGVQAVAGVSLSLPAGQVTALVGPNGAGKTTTFNLITGNLRADSGTAHIRGKPIMGLKPWQVARLGVARSFQDLRLFTHMTVRENVLAATETSAWFWQPGGARARAARANSAPRPRWTPPACRTSPMRARSTSPMPSASSCRWRASWRPRPISGCSTNRPRGSTCRRACASAPCCARRTARGVAICLIEHNLDVVAELSDRIAFLDQGRVLAEGDPQSILRDPALAAIYFGDRPQEAA